MTPQKNRLNETVLMMGHKICFYGKIWIIIPKLSLLAILSGALTKEGKKKIVRVGLPESVPIHFN